MPTGAANGIAEILAADEAAILGDWVRLLTADGADARIGRREVEAQCANVLRSLRAAAVTGNFVDITAGSYDALRTLLGEISRSRTAQDFSPAETATFILSLKEPVFTRLRRHHGKDADALGRDTWALTELIDRLGLYTMEEHQKNRENVIRRQQEEIGELSTPVVKLWQGILALPLIGTLDSSRTQVVMENLLQAIVDHAAEIAIIDITGVPTVDTLVAQHLLKTVAAARLMGADCLISGIRPQIAQTMVHLGIELTVVSKATLADAFAVALARVGRAVVPIRAARAAIGSGA
jgi:rsbT co-antagonist protein RsbR